MDSACPVRRRLGLLADRHAHYARLWRAFCAWKRRTLLAKERKQVRARTNESDRTSLFYSCFLRTLRIHQRIEAACVVGAAFAQRRFFQRWRENAAQRKAERQREAFTQLSENWRHVRASKVLLRRYRSVVSRFTHARVCVWQRVLCRALEKWKATVLATAKQKTRKRVSVVTMPSVSRPQKHQLCVLGVAIARPQPVVQQSGGDQRLHSERAASRVVVLRTLLDTRVTRRLFQVSG